MAGPSGRKENNDGGSDGILARAHGGGIPFMSDHSYRRVKKVSVWSRQMNAQQREIPVVESGTDQET